MDSTHGNDGKPKPGIEQFIYYLQSFVDRLKNEKLTRKFENSEAEVLEIRDEDLRPHIV